MTTATKAELLTFSVLAAEGGTREVTGLALPYGEILDRASYEFGTNKMRFEKGSAKVRPNAQLFYGHDHMDLRAPIGRITSTEDTDEGLKITAKISATPKGDEIYTLLQDGVITQFSIGFYFGSNEIENAGEADSTLVHTEIDVFETSVVPDPAFQSAQIQSVLSAQTKESSMTETLTPPATPETFSKEAGEQLLASLGTLSTEVENLGAKVATLGSTGEQGPAKVPFNSFGEYVQAMAAGDEDARALYLAYSGGTVSDLGDFEKDGWLGDITKWIDKGRKIYNLVDSGTLPASGMGVEYGKIATDTTQVAKQVAEGDTLAYGKITFDTDTAPLETFGGWGEASRQLVERSSVNVVDTYFKALALKYTQVTEAKVRSVLTAATAHSIAGTGAVPATSDKWIDFLVDASIWLDDKGMTPDFLMVSQDVFKGLAKLRDGVANDAPRLLDRDSGAINITGLKGDLFSVPVIPVSGTNTIRLVNSFAIKTFESGGAPLRLADEDITNLTKAFSVYGYLAVAVQDADAIVKPAA